MMKVGITPKDSQFHYVNIMGIKSHDDAVKIKKWLEANNVEGM